MFSIALLVSHCVTSEKIFLSSASEEEEEEDKEKEEEENIGILLTDNSLGTRRNIGKN